MPPIGGAMTANVFGQRVNHDIGARVQTDGTGSGVATVLSTMTGTPCLWATSAIFWISTTLPAGLPIDSQEYRFGFVIDGIFQRRVVVGREKARFDSLTRQRMGKEIVGAAVKL